MLTDFVGLNKLEKLDATDNKLENLSQIRDDLAELSRLRSLDLRGNPITKEIRCREKIVAVLQCVGKSLILPEFPLPSHIMT